VPADGGARLQERMAHYRLQWSAKKVLEVLDRWRAAGGESPL
jgi:hypothetical protein